MWQYKKLKNGTMAHSESPSAWSRWHYAHVVEMFGLLARVALARLRRAGSAWLRSTRVVARVHTLVRLVARAVVKVIVDFVGVQQCLIGVALECINDLGWFGILCDAMNVNYFKMATSYRRPTPTKYAKIWHLKSITKAFICCCSYIWVTWLLQL